MNKKTKALVLLSGGLDSLLAAKLLLEQGIEVVGLSFKSCFFDTQEAEKGAKQLKIPLKTIDEPRFLVIGRISEKHWSGIITYRGNKVRIISVRCSRKEEVDIYESY